MKGENKSGGGRAGPVESGGGATGEGRSPGAGKHGR